MTHPLNDELGQIIWKVANEKSWGFTQEDLMCAIADWQLEQVIEWIKECPNREGFYHTHYEPDCKSMIRDLKTAMRPQEES